MIYMHKIRKKIIEWLDKIKVYDFSKDNKLPGLLNKNKIQINTEKANGIYNLILKWIKNNMHKLKFLFKRYYLDYFRLYYLYIIRR